MLLSYKLTRIVFWGIYYYTLIPFEIMKYTSAGTQKEIRVHFWNFLTFHGEAQQYERTKARIKYLIQIPSLFLIIIYYMALFFIPHAILYKISVLAPILRISFIKVVVGPYLSFLLNWFMVGFSIYLYVLLKKAFPYYQPIKSIILVLRLGSGKFKLLIKKIFEFMKAASKPLFDSLSKFFKLIGNLISKIFKLISRLFKEIFIVIKEIFQLFGKLITKIFKIIANFFQFFFGGYMGILAVSTKILLNLDNVIFKLFGEILLTLITLVWIFWPIYIA